MITRKRIIAIKDFRGLGMHVYKDELGFRKTMLKEARTLVDREAFRYFVEKMGLNLAFYYPKTDKFYGIHTEVVPIKVKVLPRHDDWSDYTAWQYESDTHDDGEVIAVFEKATDIWDKLQIGGIPFEDVIRESYITALN